MTAFDLFILALLGLSILFGWIRGLSREVVTLIAIAIGLLAIYLLGTPVGGMFGPELTGPIVALCAIFILAFVVASVGLELVISRFWGRSPRKWDRVSGAIFGFLRGWLLGGLVYLGLAVYSSEENLPDFIENAALKGLISPAAGLLERMGLEQETVVPESVDTPVKE